MIDMNLFYLFVLRGLDPKVRKEPLSGKTLLKYLGTRLAQLSQEARVAISRKGAISPASFYEALRNLRDRGLVNVKRVAGVPPHNLYSLTPAGSSLLEELEGVFGVSLASGTGSEGQRKHFSFDALEALSVAVEAKLHKWLRDWYEAGLDGETRSLGADGEGVGDGSEALSHYVGELVAIVRRELGA